MHIIQDIEKFYKDIESAVYHWFGTGINGENGKTAINDVIITHTAPVITGTLAPTEEPLVKEEAPVTIKPPKKSTVIDITETPKTEVQNG